MYVRTPAVLAENLCQTHLKLSQGAVDVESWGVF